jgi:hypothetical protein
MSQNHRQDFIQAVNQAIEEQIIPRIFSAAQLAAMQLPYHEKKDHYSFTTAPTAERTFKKFYNIRPQLMINDPGIADRQINPPALRSIKVSFKGKMRDVPLSIVRENPGWAKTAQEWQKDLDSSYLRRKVVAKLEPSLKQKFNLASGKDYSIGPGLGFARKNAATQYVVQLHTPEARKETAAIKKLIEKQLKVITPGKRSRVRIAGPMGRR